MAYYKTATWPALCAWSKAANASAFEGYLLYNDRLTPFTWAAATFLTILWGGGKHRTEIENKPSRINTRALAFKHHMPLSAKKIIISTCEWLHHCFGHCIGRCVGQCGTTTARLKSNTFCCMSHEGEVYFQQQNITWASSKTSQWSKSKSKSEVKWNITIAYREDWTTASMAGPIDISYTRALPLYHWGHVIPS